MTRRPALRLRPCSYRLPFRVPTENLHTLPCHPCCWVYLTVQETGHTITITPMSIRNVMNSCVVEDFELPVGSRIYIAQTASHYMDDVFPDPPRFDIDRYLPPRAH